jgi:hypothetical protein
VILSGLVVFGTGGVPCHDSGNCEYRQGFEHGETVSDAVWGRV